MLLYGATGYTGRLIASMAAEYGLRPVLAGRNAAAVAGLAADLDLPHRAFSLDDPAALRRGLEGVQVVLHCAGPFIRTWRPMSDACLDTGTHYLDITGEIEVFEGLAARDAEATEAGVMLLPGVGFDVVPTDCLAARLDARLPSARRLTLAISSSGPLSHGTASTVLENQHRGGRIRRDGKLVTVPPAWRVRRFDFGDGRKRTAATIPWGDVSTAWHSTGIPDIEVYAAMPRRLVRIIRAARHLGWLLRSRPMQAVQRSLLRMRPAGPDEAELRQGHSHVLGFAEDDAGQIAAAALHGPNAYLLTAHTALIAVRRVLQGDARPGFLTPSLAFGEDMVREVPGVEVVDLASSQDDQHGG